MIDEGVIKFRCRRQSSAPLDAQRIAALQSWRDRLYQRGLIGYDRIHLVGYGNLSQRAGGEIIITASQTGSLERLTGEHYCVLESWDLENNEVHCRGMLDPSSESLTHIALYGASAQVAAVMHVHCDAGWQRLHGEIPTTRDEVPYGTPAMAQEFQRLFQETALARTGVAVMGGHQGGLLSLGTTPDEAGQRLFDCLDALNLPQGGAR